MRRRPRRFLGFAFVNPVTDRGRVGAIGRRGGRRLGLLRHQGALARRPDHPGDRRGRPAPPAARALRPARRHRDGGDGRPRLPRRGLDHPAPVVVRRRLEGAGGLRRPARPAAQRLHRHLRRALLRRARSTRSGGPARTRSCSAATAPSSTPASSWPRSTPSRLDPPDAALVLGGNLLRLVRRASGARALATGGGMNRPGLAQRGVRAASTRSPTCWSRSPTRSTRDPELAFAEHRAAALLAAPRRRGRPGRRAGGVRPAHRVPRRRGPHPAPARRAVLRVRRPAGPRPRLRAQRHRRRRRSAPASRWPRSPGASAAGCVVLGTPAEEGGGGKILLLRRGAFDGAAAVLLIHPGDRDIVLPPIRAAARIARTCRGRPAHAALSPHRGRNALDALVLGYQAAGALRGVLPPGDQVHGTITDGGGPPNVVPARAAAAFMVRSVDADGLARALDRTAACFTGAAAATGCRAHVRLAGPVYRELRPDSALARAYHRHLLALGRSPLPLRRARQDRTRWQHRPRQRLAGGAGHPPQAGDRPGRRRHAHPGLRTVRGRPGRRPRRAGRRQGDGPDRPRRLGRRCPRRAGPTRPAPSRYRPIRRGHRP